ncbi:MAG: hypothetical protein ACR2KT_10480 [Methylocella sp.]
MARRSRRARCAARTDGPVYRDIGLSLNQEVFAVDDMTAIEQQERCGVGLAPRQSFAAAAGNGPQLEDVGNGWNHRRDGFGHDGAPEAGDRQPGLRQLMRARIRVVPARRQPLQLQQPTGCQGCLAEDRRVGRNNDRQAEARAVDTGAAFEMHQIVANRTGIELLRADIVAKHNRPQSRDEGPGPGAGPEFELLAPGLRLACRTLRR